MASCTQESRHAGDEATVSFSISLAGNAVTKADVTTYGTAAMCDKLVYEVYDANGTKVAKLSGTIAPAFQDGLTQEVKLTLTKGQTYTFAFWAQNSGCTAYTTTDLTNVQVSYEGVTSNLENRDAFFGSTEPVLVTGNFSQTVTLKRPFAQLNLAVSDLEAASDAGITLKQVKVLVSSAATSLNVKTGKIAGPAENVLFDLSDILYKYPAAGTDTENQMLHLGTEVTIDGVAGSEYPWLGMNYLLVNDATTGAASDNSDVTFTLTTDKSDIVLLSSNTPLQRNWRTNIIAKLTSIGTFNVVIAPEFDNENNLTLDADAAIISYQVVNGEKIY